MTRGLVQDHEELEVYKIAFRSAMDIFKISGQFPKEERYSLTDQMRRSSRSVCANLAEAWRKRMYQPAFIAKLSDSLAEAAETQTWISFAVQCGYMSAETGPDLRKDYTSIQKMLTSMINNANAPKWTIPLPP
ncbi:MAG TPA: four helix bundle protein [Leptolyngbyaceae cyanobacterium M65_K2018_010]|nr:four helix bundle protein [Leptolyngbyaceae cyanobacterium M65_K2018_010]